MKRYLGLFPVLGLMGVLAACSGDDASMDDMDMSAPPEQTAQTPATAGGLSCFLAGATLAEAQQRVSPHSTLSFDIGSNPALLCYGAPSAQGREIMGGLVPYGEPWRIGADEPTTLHLSGRANVGGVPLDPGSYSLYAIPGEESWEFFINTNFQRWGIPIDADVRSTEIGSFRVTPQALPSMVERLTYEWEEATGGEPGGEILLEWENTLLRLIVEG